MGKLTKWILGVIGGLIVLALIATAIFWKDIQEIRGVLRYAQTFEEEHINDNFRSLYKQYPSKIMQHAESVFNMPVKHRELPESYTWEEKAYQRTVRKSCGHGWALNLTPSG